MRRTVVGEGSASRVLSAIARSLDLIWRDWRLLRRGQTGSDFQRATLGKQYGVSSEK